ncbi:hypothetical protein OQA88_820 [Cercophora sp. LCS_1]
MRSTIIADPVEITEEDTINLNFTNTGQATVSKYCNEQRLTGHSGWGFAQLRGIGLAFGSETLARLEELGVDLQEPPQDLLQPMECSNFHGRYYLDGDDSSNGGDFTKGEHCPDSDDSTKGEDSSDGEGSSGGRTFSLGEHCLLPVGGPVASIFPQLDVLRFVDVSEDQMCIVETCDNVSQYMALSYMWVAVTDFRLTRASRPVLEEAGAFHRVWKLLPRTIQDAITLTQKLGMRYLWVDSLCLLQNDADLKRGVNMMDHIYERAWLTVIAACGHDANAGLPGVRVGSRSAQAPAHEVSPGIFMGSRIDPDLLLQSSLYNTRT